MGRFSFRSVTCLGSIICMLALVILGGCDADHSADSEEASDGVTIDLLPESYDGVISAAFGKVKKYLEREFVRVTWYYVNAAILSDNGKRVFVSIGKQQVETSLAIANQNDDRINTGKIFDARNGELISEGFRHLEMINNVIFFDDDSKILVHSWASSDSYSGWTSKVQIFDAEAGTELLENIAHDGSIYDVALSYDSSKIIAAFDDRRVRLFDSASGEELSDPIVRATLKCGAGSIAYSRDDSRIATSAKCPRSLRVFDAEDGSELMSPVETGTFDMKGFNFSPDDRLILMNGSEYKGKSQVRLLDAATGQDVIEPIVLENAIEKAMFSEDGSRFFTLSGPKYERFNVSKGPLIFRLFDTASGEELEKRIYENGPIRDLIVKPDANKIHLVLEISGDLPDSDLLLKVASEDLPAN